MLPAAARQPLVKMLEAVGAPEWFLVYNQKRRARNALAERFVIDCAQLAFAILGLNASFNVLWCVASQFVNPLTGEIVLGR